MRRKAWILTVAAVLLASTAAVGVLFPSGANQQARAAQPSSVHTAQVEQQTLSATVSQPGTLTFRAQADGTPYSVINLARGTYTRLPAVGQVISQGEVLYRVNDSPVVLLYGSTPAYRTLSVGVTGHDVAELNADLVALHYVASSQLNPTSASFGRATATALEKLQAALGVSQTGTLTLGEAVFEPTAVRVITVSRPPGSSARPGQTVIQDTSTIRQVQVALDASQQVAVGDKVSITLPNNHTTPGIVTSVAAVATCPSSSGSNGSSSGSNGSSSGAAAPGTDACLSGSSVSSATPTVTVDVTPSHPADTGKWDQAPVQIGITTATVRDALVVPVTALLAQSGGGYAVEMVGAGARNHLVPVSLGLFDDANGRVQITASGLTAGQEVVVPAT